MALKVTHNNTEIAVPGTRRGEPLIRSISQPQITHESQLGLAFSWTSLNADLAAGSTILIVRNTSDSFLVLTDLIGMPANVACHYDIGIGSGTTTLAGGTAVVAVNLNQEFATKTFDYEAHTAETSVADATICDGMWVSTVESKEKSLAGYILGKNDYIQINQETESTSGRVTLKGFFIPELT